MNSISAKFAQCSETELLAPFPNTDFIRRPTRARGRPHVDHVRRGASQVVALLPLEFRLQGDGDGSPDVALTVAPARQADKEFRVRRFHHKRLNRERQLLARDARLRLPE